VPNNFGTAKIFFAEVLVQNYDTGTGTAYYIPVTGMDQQRKTFDLSVWGIRIQIRKNLEVFVKSSVADPDPVPFYPKDPGSLTRPKLKILPVPLKMAKHIHA
jgi:hypothetical protein